MSTASAAAQPKSAGLEGLIAGTTAICAVDQTSLLYRGFEIADLAENASFEEVAHLLLVGHKASTDELASFKGALVAERRIPDEVIDFLRGVVPHLKDKTAVPMDVLRTAVSLLGHSDPDCQDNAHEAELRKSIRLTAKIPTVIGTMQRFLEGRDPVDPATGGDPELSHAANLLYVMTGEKPNELYEKTMDVSLVLYAEHDFNASTFTSRVISATLSDMHGAICGGIAALKGPLHGGANEAAMEMLTEVGFAVETGQSVEAWMDEAFATKRKLMGFGHRVYKNGDHRAPILHALGRQIAESKNPDAVALFEMGEMVEKYMLDKKNIYPNVDFPCGMTYYTMGIPVPQYTPIFVASRVTGWCAHIMEQHQNNRLIRPIAEYTGEALRKWNDA